MHVLGEIFNLKFYWLPQVNHTIQKVNKALNATKLTKKHFSPKELYQIITSNLFSILQSLRMDLKHLLFVASSNAIKLALHYLLVYHSFQKLHQITTRAILIMFSKYKVAYYCINLLVIMKKVVTGFI
jgi:hypothetical protein